MCSGRTPKGNTQWTSYDTSNDAAIGIDSVYLDVSLSQCSFISPPVVTTALGGVSWAASADGTSQPYNIAKDSFRIYVTGGSVTYPEVHAWNTWNITGSKDLENPKDIGSFNTRVNEFQWHVQWIAVGKICSN